ncbi:MAG TPA: hypothetical protein VEB86_09525 [Chryseosolibacter sp.]|nr:hypothetical protein [Chryseosolibacter sp.]
MNKIILTVIAASCFTGLSAQDFIDNALIFSRYQATGSARIQALSGAQVSLGGDYSSALANPAGLGMFNRSEFTISPALTFHRTKSSYLGTGTDESKSVFNVPGLSLVLYNPSRSESGFLGGSFAVTLSRVNDLHLDYNLSGTNNQSSIIDYFLEDAGDIDPNELLFGGNYFYSLTGLAYNNYLIEDAYDNNGDRYYVTALGFNSVDQQEISQRKGAQYQWSIAYGANFSDKFFAGASLGIATLRYKLNQVYKESNFGYLPDADVALRDFSLQEDYDIRGSGVNFTLGGIYRPANFLQVGVSYTTPTYYQITDTYKAGMNSNWNNYDYYPDDPTDDNLNSVSEEFDQPLVSDYNLTVPMKVKAGLALISKIGLISTEVEFVNHSKAKYKSDIADDFQFENDGIRDEYTSVINLRTGAEYRLNQLRFRGGVSYMPDPLLQGGDTNRSIISFSGGVGYRSKEFYVDVTGVLSQTKSQRVPYYFSGSGPIADQKFQKTNFIITCGFNF